MQQILSAQAEEGMVLGKDVMTPDGRVLCGKGTALTQSVLSRLAKMDIVYVTVEGHPIAVPGEKSIKEQLKDVEERFSDVQKVPPLMYLKKRIMKKLVESQG